MVYMFLRYTAKLINRKQEYPKLVSNKQEEQIHLKEYVFNLNVVNNLFCCKLSYTFYNF